MSGIDRRFGSGLERTGAARDQAQKTFQGIALSAAMRFGKDLLKCRGHGSSSAVEKAVPNDQKILEKKSARMKRDLAKNC